MISKHQQVQLLEAASVLVAMNNIPNAAASPPDSTHGSNHGDKGSASPPASGFSGQHEASSANTTPPPLLGGISAATAAYRNFPQRQPSNNSYSRSYQSAPFSGSVAGSVPHGASSGLGHFRQLSQEQRPTSSGKNATGEEDQDLAAAVELLSCSFGSSGNPRTVHLPVDAPPVPPLPAQYLDQPILSGTSFISSFPSRAPESFTRGEFRRGPMGMSLDRDRDDIKMTDSGSSVDGDDDDDMRSRARSDEDDDGVFGRMEE